MRDIVLQIALKEPDLKKRLNVMREYLQAYVLRLLYEQKFFQKHAFVGGTALRFTEQLPRYSEDLDFSQMQKDDRAFVQRLEMLKKELELAGYEVHFKFNDQNVVNYAFIKFSGLLFETGLAAMKEQNLAVKMEVDLNPPAGAKTRVFMHNQFFPIAMSCYDLPSLFAGKIYALLSRQYTKGRDYFDMSWCLTRWPDLRPNLVLLNNAIEQSKAVSETLQKDNWKAYVRQVVRQADWKKVMKDMEPFMENRLDLEILLSQENLLKLLDS